MPSGCHIFWAILRPASPHTGVAGWRRIAASPLPFACQMMYKETKARRNDFHPCYGAGGHSSKGSAMTFEDILDQASAMLQRRGRVDVSGP